MQRSALCRSRRELSNEYLLAKFCFDTAENEPCKVCPLSAYRSPRYFDGIPLDLSKALFVFSFNDDKKLNSVLRDRLTVVRTKGFNQQDQLQIAQQYPGLNMRSTGNPLLHSSASGSFSAVSTPIFASEY